MKKILSSLIIILFFTGISDVFAQNYMTRNGMIRFYSEAPLENIEAVNRQVSSIVNSETGEFVFRVVMRSFKFEKALMQEHFNENYVESHKYPNASFQGMIMNINEIDFSSPGEYDVRVEGELTIKDATNKISETGIFLVNGDEIMGKCVFKVKVADYNIKIPTAVVDNIAEEVEVTVEIPLKKM